MSIVNFKKCWGNKTKIPVVKHNKVYVKMFYLFIIIIIYCFLYDLYPLIKAVA